MNIWLITDGEILPTVNNAKKMRTWRLGEALSQRGHDVIWWSSNFFHIKKEKVSEDNIDVKINDNFKAKLIDAGVYKKNISLKRIIHHRKLAKYFYKEALKQEKPDIIVVSLPSLELVEKAVRYGETFSVPVIIDIRDMWPDIFRDYFKNLLFKIIISFVTNIIFYRLPRNLKKAAGIVAISNFVLAWGLSKVEVSTRKFLKSNVFYTGYDESLELIGAGNQIESQDNLSGKIVFVFIGTFGNTYDLESVLRVAHRFQIEGNNKFHFIIAGDGNKREKLEETAKNLKNLTLLGWVDKEESQRLLRKANVYLMPILNVSLPNKFFEALFFGIPILHSIEGEAKDFTDKYNIGYYYQKNNFEELYNGIKFFGDDISTINIMRRNALELYAKKFQSSVNTIKYCQFIESFLTHRQESH